MPELGVATSDCFLFFIAKRSLQITPLKISLSVPSIANNAFISSSFEYARLVSVINNLSFDTVGYQQTKYWGGELSGEKSVMAIGVTVLC